MCGKKITAFSIIVLLLCGFFLLKTDNINFKEVGVRLFNKNEVSDIESLSTDEDWRESEISDTLKTEAYDYLPNEIKNQIVSVYEKTGEVVRTEKNKQEGKLYINPLYVSYVELSPEIKELQDVIPDMYAVDYVYNEEVGATYDFNSSFSLENVDGKRYISALKDQGRLGICWAFSAVEQAESNIYIKNNININSTSPYQTFSTRQLDYALSTNGIKNYDNSNNIVYSGRELGDGATPLDSIVTLSTGNVLVDESIIPWSESMKAKELSTVLNYDNTLYEADKITLFPSLNFASSSESVKKAYLDEIKYSIVNYGGAVISTQSPQYTCESQNLLNSNSRIIRVDADCGVDAGHAMQVIGWDDNYEYSYNVCSGYVAHGGYTYTSNNKTTHVNEFASCTTSARTTVSGKGAWLVRNSWGSNSGYDYVYVAYDSLNTSLFSITELSSMGDRSWDNNYHTSMSHYIEQDGGALYYYYYDGVYLYMDEDKPEKVEKIKFFATDSNAEYEFHIMKSDETNVAIVDKNNNPITISTNLPGIYTLDLHDYNVELSGTNAIAVFGRNGATLFPGTVSVFTSNTYDDFMIDMPDQDIELTNNGDEQVLHISSVTRNIPSNSTIEYKLYNVSEEDVSPTYITSIEDSVSYNEINSLISVSRNIPNGIYVLEAKYMSASDYMIIVVGNDREVTIQYESGKWGHIEYQSESIGSEGKSITIDAFTGSIDTASAIPYQGNDDYEDSTFIKWTKNGDDYSTETTITPTKNRFGFYSPATYKANFEEGDATVYYVSNNEDWGTVSPANETFKFSTGTPIGATATPAEGYHLDTWSGRCIDTDNNLHFTPGKNQNAWCKYGTYTANFTINTYQVSFSMNGHGETINDITIEHGGSIQELPQPTDIAYVFDGWFKDPEFGDEWNKDTDKVTSDITLYAKWHIKTYTVSFNNNGIGEAIPSQTINHGDKVTPLIELSCAGYTFDGWFTDNLFQNEFDFTAEITSDLVLYAKWTENTVKITYKVDDSSHGYFLGSNSEHVYLLEQTIGAKTGTGLLDEVTVYSEEGYDFVNWTDEDDFETSRSQTFQTTKNPVTGLYEEKTYTANFKIQTFSVTFNMNGHGSDIDSQIINWNSTATKPTNPSEIGFVFSGWYIDDTLQNEFDFSTGIKSNIVLYAKWEIATYTVTIEVDDTTPWGSVSSNMLSFVKHGSTITFSGSTIVVSYGNDAPQTVAAEPTDDDDPQYGYSFDSWSTSCDNNVIVEDCAIVAKFKQGIKSYDVIFNNNGYGVAPNTQIKEYGSTIDKPTDPTDEHYVFIGWYKDTTLENEWNFDTDVVIGKTTLYAKWEAKKYQVSFKVNNNQWGSISYEDTQYGFSYDPNSEMVAAEIPYGTTYSISDNKFYIGNSIITANNANQTDQYDFSFVEWQSNCDDSYIIGACEITAAFKTTTRKYMVLILPSVVGYGTVSPESIEVEYGTAINIDEKSLKIGEQSVIATEAQASNIYEYNFSGWVNSDCGLIVTKQCYITASFTREYARHILTYNDTAATTATVGVRYNDTFILNANGGTFGEDGNQKTDKVIGDMDLTDTNNIPTRIGYDFNGYNLIEGDDLTFEAKWTEKAYKIIFDTKGGNEISPIEVLYNYDLPELPTPTRKYYRFIGWSSVVPEKMPANDVVLDAIWELNVDINLQVSDNYIYSSDEKILDKVSDSTELSDYLEQVTVDQPYVVKVYKDNNEVVDGEIVGTGTITKIFAQDDFENAIVEFVNIVRGDTNGDGIIDFLDYIRIRKHIVGTLNLERAYAIAADYSNDGGVIDFLDYIQIRKLIASRGAN